MNLLASAVQRSGRSRPCMLICVSWMEPLITLYIMMNRAMPHLECARSFRGYAYRRIGRDG